MPPRSNPQTLLSRLTAALAAAPSAPSTPRAASESAVHADARRAQDILSGAFGVRVAVKPWLSEGALRALVPVTALTPTGIKVVEWAYSKHGPTGAVLAATLPATENSERRVAKALGEDWKAVLVGYDPASKRAVFEVTRGQGAA